MKALPWGYATRNGRGGPRGPRVERMDRIVPIEDASVGEELAKLLTKLHKMDIRVKTKITSIERHADKIVCHLEGEKGGVVEGSHLLVAVGRGPVTAGVGLEATKAKVDRGFVDVDEFMLTSEPGL